jgi:hypothetical protein
MRDDTRTPADRTPPEGGEGRVESRLVKGLIGRDECVDAAMDFIDNSLEHDEECKSHHSNTEGERDDCDCAVGKGLNELERIARLAAPVRPEGEREDARDAARYRALRAWHDSPNLPEFDMDEGAYALLAASAAPPAALSSRPDAAPEREKARVLIGQYINFPGSVHEFLDSRFPDATGEERDAETP